MRFPLITLLLPMCLCACQGRDSAAATSRKTDGPIQVELGSPDLAVKTWWKIRDEIEAESSDSCAKFSKEHEASETTNDTRLVTTGPAHVGQQPVPCAADTYSREIKEVKVESRTRAVVLANIKPSTPLPQGATPDSTDLQNRERGFPYKYVLSKIGRDWKIEQIYRYENLGDGDPWRPVFAETPSPRIHSYVYGPQ